MRDTILRHFPPRTHPLTLVADPDGVLADESVATELAGRGFRSVGDADPVLLRIHVEQARPWTGDRPLIVVTEGQLKYLPYDLWQQGHHVSLSLDGFFPNLVYPIVKALNPAQRARLSEAQPPPSPLTRSGSLTFLLRHVFGAELDELRQPAALIAWLNDAHGRAEQWPPMVAQYLLEALRSAPGYAGWPLEELLGSGEAFASFVREQWRGYVQEKTGRLLAEKPIRYVLDFEMDDGLQDDLARLVRSGALEPVGVAEPERLPAWARAGVLGAGEDGRRRRIAGLVTDLDERVVAITGSARWGDWQTIARAWAELSALTFEPGVGEERLDGETIDELRSRLDAGFGSWLGGHYAPLGGHALPTPHHVHHIPHYLAYQRRQHGADRVALLVLDGMSVADWLVIGSTWRARRPGWRLHEQSVLAQVPTITAISRQALVSGLRPMDFAATIGTTAAEPALWRAFWTREEVPANLVEYARLALDRDEEPALPLGTARALCLIDYSIDEIIHGASLGAADVAASLRMWLEQVSPRLEAVIDLLLAHGFTVYVASDHGHVEARGIGQPSEGLAVETRGGRARIYRDEHLAVSVQSAYYGTVPWSHDGVLPDDVWAVMPGGRTAFAPLNDTVVTHGGTTIDEVVVPFVTIRTG
jgi:hypothetical protein